MKTKKCFSLVELITVIVIIGILAGLVLGGVEIARRRARITQAKTDMNTIMTALKQVDTTYQKIINPGTAYVTSNIQHPLNGDEYVVLGDEDGKMAGINKTASKNAYNRFIVELTDPGNGIFTSSNPRNINARRMKFMEPKNGYDPSKDGDGSGANNENETYLWRDPWGKPYVIVINTNYSDRLPVPYEDTSANGRKILGKIAIYSCGPNGENEKGANFAEDRVDSSVTNAADQQKADDLATWSVK